MIEYDTPLPPPAPDAPPPIIECGEPLVLLNDYDPAYIRVDGRYLKQGLAGASAQQWCRVGIADKLRQAAELLPPDHTFLIWDAWRSYETQQSLMDATLLKLRGQHPDLDDPALRALAINFVAPPSRDPLAPAPHNTGGTLDLTIAAPDGRPLDTGTDFDDFTYLARTRYYDDLPDPLTPTDSTRRHNRRLLFHVLSRFGFYNYAEEWWHFEYGTPRWTRATGAAHAIYGIAASPY